MSSLKHFSNVFAVMSNEFRILRRNRSAILISLVVIPFFFTASLGAGRGGEGETYSVTAELPIAFIDKDLSEASGRLYETLVRSEDFNMLIQGYREEDALAILGKGGIYAAIVVPEGFEQRLSNNETGIIVLHVDDGSPGVDDAVISNVEASLENFNPNPRMKQTDNVEFVGVEIVIKGASFSGFAVGLTITLTMVVVFATFYEIAGGMARERETGTYAHLLVSPVSLGSIMIGKTLYDVCLNIMRTFIVLGLAVYVYGASIHANLLSLVLSVLFIAILTMGFGFLESVYEKCLLIELKKAEFQAESQKSIIVHYEGEVVGEFIADIVVEDTIILELKSVKRIVKAHEIQLVNYLVATKKPVGLLLNFGEQKVEIKRKVRELKK